MLQPTVKDCKTLIKDRDKLNGEQYSYTHRVRFVGQFACGLTLGCEADWLPRWRLDKLNRTTKKFLFSFFFFSNVNIETVMWFSEQYFYKEFRMKMTIYY